ncbi:MAG: TIM barrel protein [Verrucomicrobiota bacterium]
MNRRSFLGQLSAGGSAFALAPQLIAAESRFPLALSQYSLRSMFKDGSLDALDFPTFTADTFGIKAIDLWEGGLPKDKLDDMSYFDQLRARADEAGVHIFLHMAGAYDCDPAKSGKSFEGILASLKRGAHLECDFVRVFLKAPGTDEAAGVTACAEALKPLVEAAAEHKITVAIEPGASQLTKQGSFLVKVFEAVESDALTLMPDFGKLENNVYAGTEAMLPHSRAISCKMHSFDESGNQPDFDYPRLVKMISDSDYSGYLAIEWEGKKLEPVPGVKASRAIIERSLRSV